MNLYITADPRNVEYALRTRFDNYPKGQDFSDIFHDLLGHGIFNADGQLWKTQRKITSLQLNTRTCKQSTDQTVNRTVEDKLLPTLKYFCDAGRYFDLQDMMLRFTFDTICMVAFGVDTGCVCPTLPVVPFSKAFEDALECTMLRFFVPRKWWRVRKWLHLGKEQGMPEALKGVNKFLEKEIVARREKLRHNFGLSVGGKSDLMSYFLQMDGDAPNDDKILKDLILNFLLAGRDTSALALSWFFWLVASHPSVEKKVIEEVQHVMGGCEMKGKPVPTRAEVSQMHYLHAALTESLRLYPSVPIDIKEILEDDILPDGAHVRKNDKLVYAIHAMGRMESIWGSDCCSFRPERWLKPDDGTFTDAHVPPFHYVVFNAGPRNCLGKDIAYLMMKTVASTLLHHFKITLVPGQKIEHKLSVTLYMKNGLLVRLEPRTP
ncbi:hypothetical protein KP509_19G076400 [Ceratopteris richardii]|nr:hypothetical protein KP509_19G076400 [Ceratopteris richardii]